MRACDNAARKASSCSSSIKCQKNREYTHMYDADDPLHCSRALLMIPVTCYISELSFELYWRLFRGSLRSQKVATNASIFFSATYLSDVCFVCPSLSLDMLSLESIEELWMISYSSYRRSMNADWISAVDESRSMNCKIMWKYEFQKVQFKLDK